jgi:uncharacterized protein
MFEIAGVVLTGLGKFIFVDILKNRLIFILVSITAWTIYIWIRKKQAKGILKYWGFRKDNFKHVTMMILPFGLLSVIAFVVTGYIQGTIIFSWHIIPILIVYPLWGLIQQFLVIGLVTGNLQDFEGRRFNRSLIIVLTALLFGLIHYPYHWLMVGTFVLALFYGFIYLKARNLYVLGIFHGWLGALFFYTVVNRDPFVETMKNIFETY